MRERRSRAVDPSSRRWLLKLGPYGLAFVACAIGCATQVDDLPTPSESSAGSETAGQQEMAVSGGKASTGNPASGGSTSTVEPSAGKAGSSVSNPFGGTTSSGGKASTGSAGNAGMGGAASSAGAKNGGAAGKTGAGGSTTQAGSSSGGSASGGSGATLACLESWQNDACDTCSKQTQSDKLGCVDILDCYAANSCGPSSCAGNTDKCGANKIGKGTAGYDVAKTVYDCLCK